MCDISQYEYNVVLTSITFKKRWIDVKITSCVNMVIGYKKALIGSKERLCCVVSTLLDYTFDAVFLFYYLSVILIGNKKTVLVAIPHVCCVCFFVLSYHLFLAGFWIIFFLLWFALLWFYQRSEMKKSLYAFEIVLLKKDELFIFYCLIYTCIKISLEKWL